MNVCSAAPFLHRMFTQRALTCLPLHAHTFARSHLVHDNPKAVDGVIAASAPIWSFTGLDPVYDPNTFDQIVTTDATIGTCASQLKSAWPKILGGCSSCFFLPPHTHTLWVSYLLYSVRSDVPKRPARVAMAMQLLQWTKKGLKRRTPMLAHRFRNGLVDS